MAMRKEEHIEQAVFCYGQITNIINCYEFGANVEFTVIETKTLQDILHTKPVVEFPKFWADFFTSFIDKNDYSFLPIGKYYTLGVSAQGDLGQSCIVAEYDDEFFICMTNVWSFSENCTYGGKYRLPRNIRDLIL